MCSTLDHGSRLRLPHHGHEQVTLCTAPAGKRITVKASHVSANLKNFTWMYKQKGFPYLRDRGSADAEAKGISLWLSFDVEALSAKPSAAEGGQAAAEVAAAEAGPTRDKKQVRRVSRPSALRVGCSEQRAGGWRHARLWRN